MTAGQRARSTARWSARLAGLLALGAMVMALGWLLWIVLQVVWLRDHNPSTTNFMREQARQLAAARPPRPIDYRWVDYAAISPALKQAVIASEDARFPAHDGVDWDAIEQAWQSNARAGRVRRGGSTITMQLARNLFLTAERSYWRKAQEVIIAFIIEQVMTKRRILEIYLNVAEWGVGVFGAQAASLHHFQVPAGRIDAPQAALMAAMLPRPRYHDRHRGNIALQRRAAIILRSLPSVSIP